MLREQEQLLNCYAMDVYDTPYHHKRLVRFVALYRNIPKSPMVKDIMSGLRDLLAERHIYHKELYING